MSGYDFDNVKVDVKNKCIDRDTDLGKAFEEARNDISSCKDSNQREFLTQLLSYAEASLVIKNTNAPADASRKINRLSAQMMNSMYDEK